MRRRGARFHAVAADLLAALHYRKNPIDSIPSLI
jgi:hypothetical protein